MAEVTVLIEGYVKDDGETVQSTVTLVQDNDHNIIVDPGMTHNPRAIANALQKHGLQPDDIDTVFITHHPPIILVTWDFLLAPGSMIRE